MSELNVYDINEPQEIKHTIINAINIKTRRRVDKRQLAFGSIDLISEAKRSIEHELFEHIKQLIKIEEDENHDSIDLIAGINLPLIQSEEIKILNAKINIAENRRHYLEKICAEQQFNYEQLNKKYELAIRPWYAKFYEWLWSLFNPPS